MKGKGEEMSTQAVNPHTAAFDQAIAETRATGRALHIATVLFWRAKRRDTDAPSYKRYVQASEEYRAAQACERGPARAWWLFEESRDGGEQPQAVGP